MSRPINRIWKCAFCGLTTLVKGGICLECRAKFNERIEVSQVPTDNIDFIREAFEALVRACRGEVR